MHRRWIAPSVLAAALVAPLAPVSPAVAAPIVPGAASVPAAQPSAGPTARILDRELVSCSRSARMMGVLERDGRQLEVDAEIVGPRRTSWTFTVRHNGSLTHAITKRADGDGEVDVWRYLRDRPGTDRVTVSARASSGERCVLTLRG
ncbi:MAG: hypothetical protein R2737_09070 [Candidatus Nanopelagicales bacterium]